MSRCLKLSLCCCLLCLGACSSTTFVYNRLDFFLPWYLGDYVELSRVQKTQLELPLRSFLDWHRAEELPRYIEILDRIDANLDQPLSPAEVAGIYAEFEQAWLRLQDEALAWLLDLGQSLSDEQVAGFMTKLWKKQRGFEREFLRRGDNKYREESYDNLLDGMQDYLGRLDRAQRNRLQAAMDKLRRFDKLWLQERAAWTTQLEVILERAPGWQARLRAAISEQEGRAAPRYREVYAHNMALIFSAMADVLNARTDKQDRRLRSELGKLREDLQSLVEQGLAAGAADAA